MSGNNGQGENPVIPCNRKALSAKQKALAKNILLHPHWPMSKWLLESGYSEGEAFHNAS
jgi:hypothetical protein